MKLSLPPKLNKVLGKIDYAYVILFAVISLVYAINYSPNTSLIGWDNLPVELNPVVNIQKNWGSVWQEYQGLGLVAGNAHAVEFLRSIFVLLLTYILPTQLIRYFVHYLYILVGVLASYALFRGLNTTRWASILGALFYFFNIGTVQNFYVPFEPFSAFFAFLPLALLSVHSVLKAAKASVKQVAILSIVFLFLTFAFQVPTLFIVFSLILFLVSVVWLFTRKPLDSKNIVNAVLRLSIVWVVYIVVNLFWLLPFFYSLSINLDTRGESLTTRLSTENVRYQGLAYANIKDVSLLRGFWYSNIDYLPHQEGFGYMLQPWISWFDNPIISIIGYGFSILAFVGLIVSIVKKRSGAYIFIPILLISLFFFFGSNGVSGRLFDFVVSIVPAIGEAFRFAFTKWIVPLCLAFSFFLAEFLHFLFRKLKKYDSKKFVTLGAALMVMGIMFFYTFPYFTGNLFYQYNKFSIPSEYRQTMKFFSENESIAHKRIALLPVNSIWGWYFTDWGYRGSGFIWFGIPQAVLSRTFDVWNLRNEQFYNEFQYGIYSENPELLKFVLNKYQIDYLVLDENVIMPNADKSVFYEGTKELLSAINNIELVNKFGSISIYKVNLSSPVSNYLYAPPVYNNVEGEYSFSNIDPSYIYKQAVTVTDAENSTDKNLYPFADDKKLAAELTNGNVLTIENPFEGEKILEIPSYINEGNSLIKADLLEDSVKVDYLYPQVLSGDRVLHSLNGSYTYPINVSRGTDYGILLGTKVLDDSQPSLNTYIPSNSSLIVFNNVASSVGNISEQIYSSELYDCAGAEGGKEADKYPGSIKIFSNDKPTCVRFPTIQSSPGGRVYKVSFNYKAIEGSRIYYCLRNSETSKCENQISGFEVPQTEGYSQYTDYVYVDHGGDLYFELILDVEDELLSYYEASVRDVSIESHEILEIIPIIYPVKVYEDVQQVALSDEDFPVRLVLPELSATEMTYEPGSAFYNPDVKNCDQFSEKDFGRKFDSQNGAYEYYSTAAISCDNIKADFIDSNNSYLLTFNSRNIRGKGLDICVSGHEFDKCLIQDRLKGEGSESFILPSYPGARGVGIYIENQSIGSYETRNTLLGVSARTIPYTTLKGIHLKGKPDLRPVPNGISIQSAEKAFSYKYAVRVRKNATAGNDTKGLIVLNQSYEKGWGLYKEEGCLMGIMTPLTCQKAEAEHVLAKNWANGWVVPSVDAGYLILFWPQYLQFAGYSVLGLGALAVTILGLISVKKPENKAFTPDNSAIAGK